MQELGEPPDPPSNTMAGIHHDVRNHEAVILAGLASSKMTRSELTSLVVGRLADITKLFGKLHQEKREWPRARFDVNKSVIKVEGDFVCFPRAVTFVSSYEPTSLRVSGDSTEFERGLVNIIENACSAVAESEDPQIRITATAGSDYVEITIADNGHGMDEATRLRVFESGFTTKTQRPNHGLGLAITAKIMEHLGGTIICESQLDRGALFRIRLPAS
jgi:signal transduction histidine kinase